MFDNRITPNDFEIIMAVGTQKQKAKLIELQNIAELEKLKEERRSVEKIENNLNKMDKLGSNEGLIDFWKKNHKFLRTSQTEREDIKKDADNKTRIIFKMMEKQSVDEWKYYAVSLSGLVKGRGVDEDKEKENINWQEKKLPIPNITFLKAILIKVNPEYMKRKKIAKERLDKLAESYKKK